MTVTARDANELENACSEVEQQAAQARLVLSRVDGGPGARLHPHPAHLSEAEAHEVLYLPRGDALWRVGDRRFKVRHQLSPVERWIVDTDERLSA